MITDCAAGDVDGDGDADLLTVGDWSGIRLWINENASFREQTLGSRIQLQSRIVEYAMKLVRY
jgi:hypothetical protein